jgi:CubicO group peptidase (beta-lactamase class C family)
MPKKIYFLFLALLLSLTFSFAQSKQEKKLIKRIDELITSRLNRISPGCAILISKNGQIFYQKAFGIANLELNVPAKPDMIFRIGSITKQFTAISIFQLVEQGRISLNDSIQKFIKDFPPKGQTITIENLLTQTSGIPDYLGLELNLPNPFRIDISTKQIVDSIKKQQLIFTPFSKFEYSNSNYFLLGYNIEQVSGLSYAEYLKNNIFHPIGLKNTYYDQPAKIIPNRANGYEKTDTSYSNADFISMSTFYSAGALMSNTEDLNKWNNALYNGKILKKETIEKAHQSFKLSDGKLSEYGYGWFIRNIDESKTIEHGGNIFGFREEEIYLPHENIFVTGLFNCRQSNNDEQELCYDIVKLMLGKPLIKEITLPD